MVKITFEPLRRVARVERGTSLLKAAQQAGIRLEAACGGIGRCGKCKVVVHSGVTPIGPREREYLTPYEIRSNVRLACQALVRGPAVVSLLALGTGRERILEEGITPAVSLQPALRKYYLNLTASDLKEDKALEEIIAEAIAQHGVTRPSIVFSCLKTVPSILYDNKKGATALLMGSEVLALERGDTRRRSYGLAVDIGTTTVVGYLFDLNEGRIMGVNSALNEQQTYGSDVVSRIDHALNTPGGLKQLQARVVATINRIIENLCTVTGIRSDDIHTLVVVGNTTMNHLFWGISPRFLSRFPYNPIGVGTLCIPCRDLGISMSGFGQVFSLPLISGFIGSDTVGVILSTRLHRSRTPKMAIDIGTNGEIVLTDGRRMLACSCAAGPAFEGAHIQCGMRGASGAIDRVDFVNGAIRYHVIDEIPPKGICGSGFVDAVAGMLRAGLVTHDGRLLRRRKASPSAYANLIIRGKYNQFTLTSGDSRVRGRHVVITQRDIRQLQLAKGAIMAGIRILMERLNLREGDIKEVYMAGAFGNYVRADSALAIGLLPAFRNAKITQVGNAAGSGAKMALLSTRALHETTKIAERVEYIELAKVSHFQQAFLKGTVFPT